MIRWLHVYIFEGVVANTFGIGHVVLILVPLHFTYTVG